MKGFSYPYNPEIHAAARGTGLNVSPKAAREVCHALKGMELEKAKLEVNNPKINIAKNFFMIQDYQILNYESICFKNSYLIYLNLA